MKTIISKIELEGTDGLKYTDVGHTEDVNIINEINKSYDSTLGKFLGENKTNIELGSVGVGEFFSEYEYVHEARTQTEDVEDLGLIKVTDISQL